MSTRSKAEKCEYWREYNSADFGGLIELEYKGSFPTSIVLKEAGALRCKKKDGTDGTLTNLPAGYVHTGVTSAILSTQTAGIVVYW